MYRKYHHTHSISYTASALVTFFFFLNWEIFFFFLGGGGEHCSGPPPPPPPDKTALDQRWSLEVQEKLYGTLMFIRYLKVVVLSVHVQCIYTSF